MNLKETFGLARYALLFLALLIPAIAGQLALAQDQPGGDRALVIDVYSGAVAPDATQEKVFWLWLQTLQKTEDPSGLPKVIHIEHALLGALLGGGFDIPGLTKDENGHSRFEVH